METIIDTFMSTHSIDSSVKDPLIELINGCFSIYIGEMSKEWLDKSTTSNPVKAIKESSKESSKIEDISQCESEEDVKKCTVTVLTSFCKTNGLKVGGSKKDLSDRVWRHIQGNSSDEDKSSKTKAKKTAEKKVHHECCGKNKAGDQCGLAGSEEKNGKWYCFRHIDLCEKTDVTKDTSETVSKDEESVGENSESEQESVKVKISKKQPKKQKKPIIELEEE